MFGYLSEVSSGLWKANPRRRFLDARLVENGRLRNRLESTGSAAGSLGRRLRGASGAAPSLVVLNQSVSPEFVQVVGSMVFGSGANWLVTGDCPESQPRGWRIIAGPKYDRGSTARRIASWLRFVVRAFLIALSVPGRPMLLAATNPPLLPHVSCFAAWIRQLPTAIIVWDLYPHHLVAAQIVSKGNPLTRAWSAMNRSALRRADVVITIGERMAALVRDEMEASNMNHKVVVIPNWADTRSIQPLDKADNPLARAQQQVDVTTVLYSGNIGRTHGLGFVVDAAIQLRDLSAVTFFFVGDGSGASEIRRKVQETGAQNVRFLPFQPAEALPLGLAMGDIGLVGQATGTEHLSVPSKTYSYMAAGCAVIGICSEDSDLASTIRQYDIGTVCPPGDSSALAGSIRSMIQHPGLLARYRANARRAAVEHFSCEMAISRFTEILAPLMDR